MQYEIMEVPDYKSNQKLKTRYDALQCSMDVLNWIFNISWHLDRLNKLHNYLDGEVEEPIQDCVDKEINESE
jgi:hypothetical protein